MLRIIFAVCLMLVAVWANPLPLQGSDLDSASVVDPNSLPELESLEVAESANPEPQWGYGK